MKKTFQTFNFGCRVNEAEKQEIDRQMIKEGYIYSEANPAIYIINTCAVTQKAEREARQHIYQIKKRFPESYIVITGCSATYWHKNSLYEDLPVDLMVKNINKEYLVKLLKKQLQIKEDIAYQKKLNNVTGYLEQQNTLGSKLLNSGRVLVKIQDGCQRFCTYCIVPYLRGKPKSERIKNISKSIDYLQSLSLRGASDSKRRSNLQEIILTSINTEAFGYDTGESFVGLLKTIIDKTNVPRISMGSIHPWSINTDFLKFYKEYKDKKRMVDFFHIPVQSGSDKILSLMKREYTKGEMLEKVQSINRLNSMAFIGTDIIVGFLDETDRDFEDTYQFLEKSPISKFHVFRFSNRNNTAAWYMKKRLMEPKSEIKVKRAKILIDLGKNKYQKFLEKHINKAYSALILEKKVNGYHEALLSNQIPIYIKTSENNIAKILAVKVNEHKNDNLFGKLI